MWNKAEARDRLQQRSGGCEGRVRRPFESELTGLESSVEYQRHELNEWYSNEGYGLERYFSEKQLSGTAREREPLVAISSG